MGKIFIHWGVYSVPSWGKSREYAEWYWKSMDDKKPDNVWWQFHGENYGENFDYQEFAPKFRAELFDAGKWADVFARSGAKYIVPTSKHHDGFCLWPSAEASKTWGRPWNAVEIGPKRDLMGELAEADAPTRAQVRLLLLALRVVQPALAHRPEALRGRTYDPAVQGSGDPLPARPSSSATANGTCPPRTGKARNCWPGCSTKSPCKDEVVVNDRWGKECRHKHGGYWTTEYAAGLKDASHPWEESRGMAYSYGYNRAERIDDYKTARELILVLCDLVSRGGNFLWTSAPTADGTIPAIMEQRLLEIGLVHFSAEMRVLRENRRPKTWTCLLPHCKKRPQTTPRSGRGRVLAWFCVIW